MVVPRTRRASSMIGVEPSEDKTQSKVVLEDEGNEAQVIEQIGAKTVTYQAKVKEVAAEIESDDDDTETFNGFDESAHYPQIPKSALDEMFEDVQFAVANESAYDTFLAKIVRQPDMINDKFATPCRDLVEMGVIQFTSLDRFNFIPAIQDTNNHSGGRFTISIYNSEYKSLEVMRGMSYRPRPVGLTLVVPNPPPKVETNATGAPDGLTAILEKMVEIQQANHNQLMQVINRKPEKSVLEAAIEQKVLNDILNPPQNNGNTNDNGLQNIMANVMGSIAVTQAMGDALAKSINREPPQPPEPDWMDKAEKFMNMPIAKELGARIVDIGDALAVKGLKLGEQAPEGQTAATQENPNPTQEGVQELDEMQELTLTIIDELESDNKFDNNNQVIQELKADYPDQFDDLQAMCKMQGSTFEGVFGLLLNRTSKMIPFPFTAYLNLDETNKQQTYVWNEQGSKMIERLKELYEYLKTN